MEEVSTYSDIPEGFKVIQPSNEEVEKESVMEYSDIPKGFKVIESVKEEETKPKISSKSSDIPEGFQVISDPQPDQDQPMFTMDDLNTNKDWLKHARTIYKYEEGEEPKKTDKELAEWLKDRHSELGWDMTSMGWLASKADEFDPETKRAWSESMDIYENTDADTMSFFRAL